MGKNIKSYAITQVHSPGKGREALRQKVQIFRARNVIRFNRTHSFLNLQQNFSNKIFHSCFVLWQISSKLSKICSIRLHTPRIMRNSHQLLTHLYYIMFQAPAPAENSQEFQRIMQILRNLPT